MIVPKMAHFIHCYSNRPLPLLLLCCLTSSLQQQATQQVQDSPYCCTYMLRISRIKSAGSMLDHGRRGAFSFFCDSPADLPPVPQQTTHFDNTFLFTPYLYSSIILGILRPLPSQRSCHFYPVTTIHMYGVSIQIYLSYILT